MELYPKVDIDITEDEEGLDELTATLFFSQNDGDFMVETCGYVTDIDAGTVNDFTTKWSERCKKIGAVLDIAREISYLFGD